MQSPCRATQTHAEEEVTRAHVFSCGSKISSASRQERSEDEWNQLVGAVADLQKANVEFHQMFQDLRSEMTIFQNEMRELFRNALTDILQSQSCRCQTQSMDNHCRGSFDPCRVEVLPDSSKKNADNGSQRAQLTNFQKSHQPLLDYNSESSTWRKTYHCLTPRIPPLTSSDPRQFMRMKIALDNELPEDATERFKFQILTNHLKCEEALLVADSFISSTQPYTEAMKMLTNMYGQPDRIIIQQIRALVDGPDIQTGDKHAFLIFVLRVKSIVEMWKQQRNRGHYELNSCSQASLLVNKLPEDLQNSFNRFTEKQKITLPTLLHLAEWLNNEIRVQQCKVPIS